MEEEKNMWDILLERYPNFFEEKTMIYSSIPRGWNNIFISLLEEAKKYIEGSDKEIDFKILQFKQKWFRLTIYHSGGDEYLDDLVRKAEAAASNYCSRCGVFVDTNINKIEKGMCLRCESDRWKC